MLICYALLADARAKCRLDGFEVIQSAPTSYVVDEARGVRDPSGMFCQRMGVTMHAVAVKPSPLQNLKLAVERCHLIGRGCAVRALCERAGHADARRNAARRDRHRHGRRRRRPSPSSSKARSSMPTSCRWAARIVTSDLARMLAAPVSAAERLKTLYGAALGDIESGTDVVTVPQMGEDGDDYAVRVPRSMLTRIIQPRLEEIFAEVQIAPARQRLRCGRRPACRADRRRLPAGGHARTGATRAQQTGAASAARRSFAGLPAASAGPDYAAALGLLMAGATMPPEALNPESGDRRTRTGQNRFLPPTYR